jgi:hypothetical protein
MFVGARAKSLAWRAPHPILQQTTFSQLRSNSLLTLPEWINYNLADFPQDLPLTPLL